MAVEFGELPPSPGGKPVLNHWLDEVAQLRAAPGQWALIATKASNRAAGNMQQHIRGGVLIAFRPAGAFEAARRGRDVWARYVGEQS